MTKLKLVSDAQAREVGKLARDMRLPRSAFQDALANGAIETFLRGLIPDLLEYPSWVKEHLTPELEATAPRDPGEVKLWFDPRQHVSPYPTGHDVYAAVKENGLLDDRSLSYGDLKWYEENPDRIPADWRQRGLWVYGWASVVRLSYGSLRVPSLDCSVGRPCVGWYDLGSGWDDSEPAGLRK